MSRYTDEQVAALMYRCMVVCNRLVAEKEERIKALELELAFANESLSYACGLLAGE